jgi:hypothetical protein
MSELQYGYRITSDNIPLSRLISSTSSSQSKICLCPRLGSRTENGPIHDAIFNLLLPREQTHVGADTGIGVLIKIERAADVRGKPLP